MGLAGLNPKHAVVSCDCDFGKSIIDTFFLYSLPWLSALPVIFSQKYPVMEQSGLGFYCINHLEVYSSMVLFQVGFLLFKRPQGSFKYNYFPVECEVHQIMVFI